jgi:hypothetical protein
MNKTQKAEALETEASALVERAMVEYVNHGEDAPAERMRQALAQLEGSEYAGEAFARAAS